MIDNGECESRADLSRKLGISRARVTQMLQLLELDKTTLKELSNLGDPLPSAIRITERKLRKIKNQSGK